jgi:hypothetical protein
MRMRGQPELLKNAVYIIHVISSLDVLLCELNRVALDVTKYVCALQCIWLKQFTPFCSSN